uniref:Uncharacterized protein MANES_10G099500 n=1 Tax=Rhizophora mucronata TaxID=61149 RepID=A0A2P2MYE7_RHIMU
MIVEIRIILAWVRKVYIFIIFVHSFCLSLLYTASLQWCSEQCRKRRPSYLTWISRHA